MPEVHLTKKARDKIVEDLSHVRLAPGQKNRLAGIAKEREAEYLGKHGGEYPQGDLATMEAEVLSPEEAKIAKEISEKAAMVPEVRFNKRPLNRPFNDDELKLIAAALRSRTALYRIADVLRCSYGKIKKEIERNEVLRELAMEQVFREKEETEEAIDDCIKARVPAVVMWKAEKLMPEKYGTQQNLDNEDDTRLVIGAIPEAALVEADEILEQANEQGVPEVGLGAVADAVLTERSAEMAAGGAGVSVEPLDRIPPAPAVAPPPGDPNFTRFHSAADLQRVVDNQGMDNYGDISNMGGGGEPFAGDDDGFWN